MPFHLTVCKCPAALPSSHQFLYCVFLPFPVSQQWQEADKIPLIKQIISGTVVTVGLSGSVVSEQLEQEEDLILHTDTLLLGK